MLYEISYSIESNNLFESDNLYWSGVVEAPAPRDGHAPRAVINFAEQLAYEQLVEQSYGQQNSTEMAVVKVATYFPPRLGYSHNNTTGSSDTLHESLVRCIRHEGIAHRFTTDV